MLKEKQFYVSFIFCLVISFLAWYLSKLPYLKLFGHLVIALIIGMLMQLCFKEKIGSLKSANAFVSNKFLRLGIILLGFKLAIDKLFVGSKITILAAFLVVVCMLVITYALCRLFKVERDLALLGASGCAICGAAAVMGVSSQIKAKGDDAVVAVSVVAILGTVFTLIEVGAKPYLALSDMSYGYFTGATLHEIAHAVAAGSAGGNTSLEYAILMKLSRVLMLVVLLLIISFFRRDKNANGKIALPYFIFFFVLMSVLGSYVDFIKNSVEIFVNLAYIILAMAMAALGMNVNFSALKERGISLLIACFLSSSLLMLVVYGVIKLFN